MTGPGGVSPNEYVPDKGYPWQANGRSQREFGAVRMRPEAAVGLSCLDMRASATAASIATGSGRSSSRSTSSATISRVARAAVGLCPNGRIAIWEQRGHDLCRRAGSQLRRGGDRNPKPRGLDDIAEWSLVTAWAASGPSIVASASSAATCSTLFPLEFVPSAAGRFPSNSMLGSGSRKPQCYRETSGLRCGRERECGHGRRGVGPIWRPPHARLHH